MCTGVLCLQAALHMPSQQLGSCALQCSIVGRVAKVCGAILPTYLSPLRMLCGGSILRT